MKEVIWEYWKVMFAEHLVSTEGGVLEFKIPEFPEPLMSAHFVTKDEFHSKNEYLNILTTEETPGCMYYHVFEKPHQHSTNLSFEKESLAEALSRPSFWDFQKNHYPESFPFMKRLLPFLALRNHHDHIFLGPADRPVASLIVGQTPSINFLFNASVPESHRGQGLMKELMSAVLDFYPQKRSFYWTVHPWLKLNAALSLHYKVLKRSPTS